MTTTTHAWVSTQRSRGEARQHAATRHPWLYLTRRLRHVPAAVPTARPPATSGEALARLAELPISVWTYAFDPPHVRHLGPMAQDFATAFGLGADPTRIDSVDACGVAMAAIQALHQRVQALEAELQERTLATGASAA